MTLTQYLNGYIYIRLPCPYIYVSSLSPSHIWSLILPPHIYVSSHHPSHIYVLSFPPHIYVSSHHPSHIYVLSSPPSHICPSQPLPPLSSPPRPYSPSQELPPVGSLWPLWSLFPFSLAISFAPYLYTTGPQRCPPLQKEGQLAHTLWEIHNEIDPSRGTCDASGTHLSPNSSGRIPPPNP